MSASNVPPEVTFILGPQWAVRASERGVPSVSPDVDIERSAVIE